MHVALRRQWHSVRMKSTFAVKKLCKQTVSSTIGLHSGSYALVIGLACIQNIHCVSCFESYTPLVNGWRQ